MKKQPPRYHDPLLFFYRRFTLWMLERMLQQAGQTVCKPVPGRLLYVASNTRPYHFNGYSARTQSIVTALQTNGVDVRVMTRPGYPWDIGAEGLLPQSDTTLLDGVTYRHVRQPGLLRPFLSYVDQAASAVARLALAEQVAVIHAATNFQNAMPALLAARRLGLPFQYEMRGLWELSRASRWPTYAASGHYKFGLACEGMLVRHADKVFSISDALKRFAAQRWAVPEDRFVLLPNCVEPAEFATPDPAVVMPRRIGYAGALVAYEGLDTLIEAVALLKQEGVAVELNVMGDGAARAQLQAMVDQLDVADRVRLLGKIAPDEARQRLTSCALICIPRKPFEVCRLVPPLKLIEALAMGKPVVVPDMPLFRDELGSDQTGWFFRPGDAGDLSKVLSEALSSPQELVRRGKLGREYATSSRRWGDHVSALVVG